MKNKSGKLGALLEILFITCFLGGIFARINYSLANIIWISLVVVSVVLGMYSIIKNKSYSLGGVVVSVGAILMMFEFFGLFLDSM